MGKARRRSDAHLVIELYGPWGSRVSNSMRLVKLRLRICWRISRGRVRNVVVLEFRLDMMEFELDFAAGLQVRWLSGGCCV